MAFRFVRFRGVMQSPTVILTVAASGTIQRGSIVEFSRTNNRVEPASASTTYTNIFGIALDYVEGASNTKTRVIPIVPGQLWEADCANAPTTAQIFIKHGLQDAVTLRNTSYDRTVATGIFIAYLINTAVVTGANASAIIGEFIRAPVGFSTNTAGYF